MFELIILVNSFIYLVNILHMNLCRWSGVQ